MARVTLAGSAGLRDRMKNVDALVACGDAAAVDHVRYALMRVASGWWRRNRSGYSGMLAAPEADA